MSSSAGVGVVLAISGLTGSDSPLAGLRSAVRPHPASISTDASEMMRVNFMASD